jgi:iduronate 2-sulfatase
MGPQHVGMLSRRSFLAGAGAGVAIALTGCASTKNARSKSNRQSKRPNVLYFTADDLGARLGVYGNPHVHTPHADAFAKESLLFERCYCQCAICGASRISILTGVRPEKSHIFGLTEQWRQRLPDATSLVRLFRDSGYRTYGVGKINDPRNGRLDDAWTVDETTEGGVADASQPLEMLRRVANDSALPFFLAVGTRQPHCPWTPSPQSLATYTNDPVPVEAPGRQMDASCGYPDQPLTESRAQYFTELHYADITDVDAMFGAVMRKADELGLLDNTIVIFWSGDHGYSLGENGVWGKWTNYDVVTRIPLLMKVPGMRTAGKRTPALVEAVDMYPTLVELCGLPSPPQHLDGVSFVPLFSEPQRPWKTAAFNVSAPYGAESAMKTGRYDFILDGGSGETEVYDLTRDPMETHNLAASSPQLRETLRRKFEAGPDAAKPAANARP